MLERSLSREYSLDAFARAGMAMASVRAGAGPPPRLTTTRHTITARTGSGAPRPSSAAHASTTSACANNEYAISGFADRP